MPTPSTFYYNSTNFCDATDIWTDADLTTPAADGWFQVGEVYRQKTGGVLGPCHDCPSCGPGIAPCGFPVSANGAQGVYRVNFNVGSDVGAVILKWNPINIPDMLTWTYDGLTASEFSSRNNGYRQGYMGLDAAGAALVPPMVNGSPAGPYPSGTSFVWNQTLNTFISAGPEAIPQVPASDVSLTATGYTTINSSFAVVPKTNPTSDLVEIMVYGPGSSTLWELKAFCPQSLNAFPCNTPGGACSPLSKMLYTCSVEPGSNGIYNMLGLNDWVFTDSSGVNSYANNIVAPATTIDVAVLDGDGSTKCITIDTNGVITNIVPCAGTC